jgi:hypothetical protein
MIRYSEFKPGRVFVVPLLGGGFAFGVHTFLVKRFFSFGNIFDYFVDEPIPPPDLSEKQIVIFDVQGIVGEFTRFPVEDAGEPWWFTNEYVHGPASKMKNRYFLLGGPPPKRKDILGIEPTVPIPLEEAKKYPELGKRFPPYTTAEIEVAVKRLDVTPDQLIAAWRAGRPKSKRNRPPLITKGPARIRIEMPYEGEGLPTKELLHKRHLLEDQLMAIEAGEITDVGGGMGVVEIYLNTNDVKRSWPLVKKSVKNAGLKLEKDARLDTFPLDEDE